MKLDFKPEFIPLFPLKGALLLPNTKLPLNIFEAKYLEMIKDTIKSENRLIGMIQPLEISNKNSTTDNIETLYNIGCAGKITSFEEMEDGRYIITLTGYSRFFLNGVKDSRSPYLLGKVDWSRFSIDIEGTTLKEESKTDYFFEVISDYFTSKKISTDWDALKSADQETLVNSLSMLCPFENYEKQALLEAYNIVERKQVLTSLMKISSQNQGNDLVQ